MDFEPRQLDGHLLEILSSLAELVMREIEQDLAANLIPGACAPQWAKKSAPRTLTTPTSTLDPAALASTGSLPSHSPYNRGIALQHGSATLESSPMNGQDRGRDSHKNALPPATRLARLSAPPANKQADNWCMVKRCA